MCVKMLLVTFIFITKSIRGEWVEIPQLTSKRYINRPGLSTDGLSTTPSGYDVFMQTPFKIETTTVAPKSSTFQFEHLQREPALENLSTQQQNNATMDEAQFEDVHEQSGDEAESEVENELNFNGFLPLLKNIQETLTNKAKKSIKSKIALLQNLRDHLLGAIDEKMSTLWRRSSKQSPEGRGHDEHEMDFPSNEGALMTIGFLTFAVFLIKLVLKLIYALKNKANNTMTTTFPTGVPTVIGGRKKRDAQYYETIKILQLIDEYNFR